METTASIADAILAGCIAGLIAGVAGALVRHFVNRRLPFTVAMTVGVLVGGAAGVLVTSTWSAGTDKVPLMISAGVVGAAVPWLATRRFLTDKPEDDESRDRSGQSAPRA